MKKAPLVATVVLIAVASISVAVSARRDKIIDQAELEVRIKSLYIAEQKEDWQAWYSLIAPTSREQVSFEEFLADSRQRDFTMVSWSIKKVLESVDFQNMLDDHKDEELEVDPTRISSVAEVSMKVRIEYSGERLDVEDQTDYWMRYDGVWYWYWRGWPYD